MVSLQKYTMPQRRIRNIKKLSTYFVFLPAHVFLVEIGTIVFKNPGWIVQGESATFQKYNVYSSVTVNFSRIPNVRLNGQKFSFFQQ